MRKKLFFFSFYSQFTGNTLYWFIISSLFIIDIIHLSPSFNVPFKLKAVTKSNDIENKSINVKYTVSLLDWLVVFEKKTFAIGIVVLSWLNKDNKWIARYIIASFLLTSSKGKRPTRDLKDTPRLDYDQKGQFVLNMDKNWYNWLLLPIKNTAKMQSS